MGLQKFMEDQNYTDTIKFNKDNEMNLRGKRVKCKIRFYEGGRHQEKMIEAKFICFMGTITISNMETTHTHPLALVIADNGDIHNVFAESVKFLDKV